MGIETSIEASDKKPAQKDSAADLSAAQWSKTEKQETQAPVASNGSKDSASENLQKVTITDADKDKAASSETKSKGPEAKPEAPKASTSDSPVNGKIEANSYLMQAADKMVDQSIYQLPKWARLPKPDPGLGCVSSFSNRYREALKLSGIINSVDDKEHRNYYQVNMDKLNTVMGNDQLLIPIAAKDAREGDIIEGVTPDSSKRHMGIVGRIENGTRTAYDNYAGKWRHESLEDRFGDYKEKNYYRAFLPTKK